MIDGEDGILTSVGTVGNLSLCNVYIKYSKLHVYKETLLNLNFFFSGCRILHQCATLYFLDGMYPNFEILLQM